MDLTKDDAFFEALSKCSEEDQKKYNHIMKMFKDSKWEQSEKKAELDKKREVIEQFKGLNQLYYIDQVSEINMEEKFYKEAVAKDYLEDLLNYLQNDPVLYGLAQLDLERQK